MLTRIRKAMEEKEEGFTLIELLVVIIIIGILAAIAIPVFLNQRKKGWDAQAKSDLKNAATAEETYLTTANHYTATVGDLTATDIGFKETSGVTLTVPKLYDASNAVTTTLGDAVGGYCLQAVSKSSNTFFYDSTSGGLVAACHA